MCFINTLMGVHGLEPWTSSLSGTRSNQTELHAQIPFEQRSFPGRYFQKSACDKRTIKGETSNERIHFNLFIRLINGGNRLFFKFILLTRSFFHFALPFTPIPLEFFRWPGQKYPGSRSRPGMKWKKSSVGSILRKMGVGDSQNRNITSVPKPRHRKKQCLRTRRPRSQQVL